MNIVPDWLADLACFFRRHYWFAHQEILPSGVRFCQHCKTWWFE